MIKKALGLILGMGLMVSLVACGGGETTDTTSPAESPAASPESPAASPSP